MSELEIEIPPGEPVIAFRRVVKAPPDLVFRIYTEPEHLRRWWGPRHLDMVLCEIDLRVGGTYRFVHRAPDGQEFGFHGEYRVIERPYRLVKSFVYEGTPDDEAVDTFTFEPVDEGTLISCRTVHSSIAARDAHAASGAAAGLTASYQRLDEWLASLTQRSSPVSTLVLKMSMSLDGYVAPPDGRTNWIFPSYTDDATAWTVETLRHASAHLMGAVTYRDMAAHWPQSTSVYAAPMNEIPKVVFSTTLTTADWGDTRILAGDLTHEIKRLKQEPGSYLLAHGGTHFARSLCLSGLVDEFRLLVHPVVLGEGQRIFVEPMSIEPITTTAFSGGAVAHVCRPG
jgi:uncharacterized protein YndB with AHSA1/START domain/dihydrofolate reductase